MLTRLEKIHYEITGERLHLIEFARKLRQDATDPEALLWACLRNRRVNKRKFRRQHPRVPYVLDFYCADLKLAIELDGGQHNTTEGKQHDKAREAFLRSQGIETLRFTNDEMMQNTDGVMNVIWDRTSFTP
ncbi:endonuclease domain-containing protein [Prosthecobacter sp.]|uniref:endonuclease domain-containing protein n=1 Tax=Prosthecobacter sp. TaxID=1965333 RepID=UPI0037851855